MHKAKCDRMERRNIQFINIVGNFNNSLSIINRTSSQKSSKNIEDLNNIPSNLT